MTVVWGGIGREVRHTAGSGMPLLPGGPHKLYLGPPFEVSRGPGTRPKHSQKFANPLNPTPHAEATP